MKYSDVLPILEHAFYNNGVRYPANDERHAIHLVWRMNRCRKEMRIAAGGECVYDKFVIRAVGDEVVLAPRFTPDLSKATRLDGSPLAREIPVDEAKGLGLEEE